MHSYVDKNFILVKSGCYIEADILGLTDDDIEFQVHNIEEMVSNVERHDNDD
jgi:hypothetical protein